MGVWDTLPNIPNTHFATQIGRNGKTRNGSFAAIAHFALVFFRPFSIFCLNFFPHPVGQFRLNSITCCIEADHLYCVWANGLFCVRLSFPLCVVCVNSLYFQGFIAYFHSPFCGIDQQASTEKEQWEHAHTQKNRSLVGWIGILDQQTIALAYWIIYKVMVSKCILLIWFYSVRSICALFQLRWFVCLPPKQLLRFWHDFHSIDPIQNEETKQGRQNSWSSWHIRIAWIGNRTLFSHSLPRPSSIASTQMRSMQNFAIDVDKAGTWFCPLIAKISQCIVSLMLQMATIFKHSNSLGLGQRKPDKKSQFS